MSTKATDMVVSIFVNGLMYVALTNIFHAINKDMTYGEASITALLWCILIAVLRILNEIDHR